MALNSAEMIAGNEDLMEEILLRLPVKPLLRFKSVSRQWFSLISSLRFSSLHPLRHPLPSVTGLFLRIYPLQFTFLPLNPSSSSPPPPPLSIDFFHDVKILQSCNGLLLCSSLPKLGHPITYYMSNPTTKQLSILPSLVPHSNATIFGLCLAFDPFKSSNYKVICVRSTDSSIYHYQIEVYRSEIGAWRSSEAPFVAPFDMVFDNGVFWNGAVHWISPKGNTLCFHVENECIFNMPKPPFSDGWGRRRFRYFAESGGHLHLIEIYGPRSHNFDVFEMKKDYSAWQVRYQVDLDNVLTTFPEMVRRYLDAGDSNYYAFVVLSLVEEEDEGESSLLLHIPGKIISFNVKKKAFKIVSELACDNGSRTKESLQFGWLDAYQHIETLARVG